ncbi:MAG: hypothetical protein ACR2PL_05935 [Dehalococcoidia bacterium]
MDPLRRAGLQQQQSPGPPKPKVVPSLLDAMQESREYESILSLVPTNPDPLIEIRRALSEVEAIRQRPCLCYVANVAKPAQMLSIDFGDGLPFNEMVDQVKSEDRDIVGV